MYKKLVGIVVFGLLISTAMSAVGIMNEKEKLLELNRSDYLINNPTATQSINILNQGGIFIQLPPSPEASNSQSWTSSSAAGYYCYEDFWSVTSPICDVHWWGNAMIYEGGTWYQGDPEGLKFNISFWDGAGYFITSYEDIEPTITYTGIDHWSPTAEFYKKLYYFETVLDPCFERASGWIGIQSTYSPSGSDFLWMRSFDGNNRFWQEDDMGGGTYWGQDLAVMLTDGEPANPVLECMGNLKLSKVPPGSNINGSFRVRNHGDATSVLQWRLDNSSIPSWGNDWTFNPSANFQTPDMEWLIVNFSFIAPDEKNTKYTGALRVVNALDTSEYCLINLSIKTPRIRIYENTFYLQLFERFPNAFLLFRQLLGFL